MEFSGLVPLKLVVCLVFLCLVLYGCRTVEYVPVQHTVVRTDTLRQTALRVDSVFRHDSVAVYVSGDTVRITQWRDRYRVKMLTDTLYKSVSDTVRVCEPYPVEKKLTKWQQAKMELGGLAFALLFAALCVAVVWLAKKFRK